MAGLVVRNDPPLFLAHNAVLLLFSYQHLLHRVKQVFLADTVSAHLYGIDRRLVYHIGKVGTHRSAGRQGDLIQIHGIVHQHILCMYLQDLHTPLQIRFIHNDPPVETSRAKQCLIQNFRSVGRGKNNDAALAVKSVHLRQKLVQRLFPFFISAAVLGIPAPADGINFIDEHDTGRIFLSLPEQIPYTGCAQAYIKFNKV